MTFRSIVHIERRAGATGSQFFSPETLRFFGSVVDRNVYPVPHGALFVTGENDMDGPPRRYTVRYASERPGERFDIGKVGEFRQWSTLRLARAAAEKAAAAITATGEVPDTAAWSREYDDAPPSTD